jgi:hypothetical protein
MRSANNVCTKASSDIFESTTNLLRRSAFETIRTTYSLMTTFGVFGRNRQSIIRQSRNHGNLGKESCRRPFYEKSFHRHGSPESAGARRKSLPRKENLDLGIAFLLEVQVVSRKRLGLHSLYLRSSSGQGGSIMRLRSDVKGGLLTSTKADL